MVKILEHVIVLGLYILLTLIVFYKIFILDINEWIIGDHADAWEFIWDFWWIKNVILKGGNLFYTDYLFYPHGISLYFQEMNRSGILTMLPLLLFINNLKLVYNLAILLAFVLSCYFMYLFLKYFLKITMNSNSNDKKDESLIIILSFLGGAMYAFSPFVAVKAIGQFNMLSVQWFPLSLLFTLKLLNKFSLKGILYVSLSILFLFFGGFHYFYYYFIFMAFYLIFNHNYKLKNFGSLGLAIFFSILIISLIYIPAFVAYKKEKELYVRTFQTIRFYNYFLPSPFTLSFQFFPKYMFNQYNISANILNLPSVWFADSVVYLGIGFLFLLIMLLLYFIKYKNKPVLKKTIFPMTLFIFSAIIALGSSTGLSLFLNNILRNILPFFDLLPVPSRHSFLTLVSLVLLITFLSYNYIKIKKGYTRFIFLFVLFSLFFVEYFPLFYSGYYLNTEEVLNGYNHIDVPKSIYNMFFKKESFTVLNIPHGSNTQGMYLQTIYNKKNLNGKVTREEKNSSFILDKIELSLRKEDKKEILDILKENKVKYIILNLHYKYCCPGGYNYEFEKILNLLKNEKIDESKDIIVYKLIYD